MDNQAEITKLKDAISKVKWALNLQINAIKKILTPLKKT